MLEVELAPPAVAPDAALEAFALELGLLVQRGTLKSYPGCAHWHLTIPRHRGTLEATWWPAKNRLWLSVHANRQAPWQAGVIEQFRGRFG
jgi:hypothetical protein